MQTSSYSTQQNRKRTSDIFAKMTDNIIFKSLYEAVKQYEQFDMISKGDQEKILKELDSLDSKEELIKRYIDTKYTERNAKTIRNKAEKILKEIEDKENNKHLQIKEASRVFAPDLVDFAEIFYTIQPFFYDKSRIWWFWDKVDNKWVIVDDTDVMNEIYEGAKSSKLRITSPSVKSEILTCLQMVGRKNMPKDAPEKWIQFKDKAFSLNSKNIYKVTPEYFFTNPIPWDIGKTEDTPTIDKLFKDWVGEKYVKTLYQIIAYCCYRKYPIHSCFCFIGGGRNGKSQFQKIVAKFIGEDNLTSSSLDAIKQNRFETFKMYKKLVCLMGETNFALFDDTDTFKRITGGDPISYEKKGKDGFTGWSYSKVLINSNSLPISEDNSEGFYRRWFIIDFPNNFPEGKDIVETIPDQEYNNLARKITNLLPELLSKHQFHNQGTIEDRKQKYIQASNPLCLFIDEYCYKDPSGYIKTSEFYSDYTKYLKEKKRRIITRKEFSRLLTEEGYVVEKTTRDGISSYYVFELSMKEGSPLFVREEQV